MCLVSSGEMMSMQEGGRRGEKGDLVLTLTEASELLASELLASELLASVCSQSCCPGSWPRRVVI